MWISDEGRLAVLGDHRPFANLGPLWLLLSQMHTARPSPSYCRPEAGLRVKVTLLVPCFPGIVPVLVHKPCIAAVVIYPPVTVAENSSNCAISVIY